MNNTKRIFEKMSAIAVILYFSYFLFFINIKEEIVSIFRECWRFFWAIVNGSPASIIISSLLVFFIAIGFIDWILDNDIKKRKKKKENKEELTKIAE